MLRWGRRGEGPREEQWLLGLHGKLALAPVFLARHAAQGATALRLALADETDPSQSHIGELLAILR